MENILSMLYRGDGSILETAYEKHAAHILALGKADALEEEFRDKLPQELLPLFDQLKDAVMSVLDTCGYHDFTIGYSVLLCFALFKTSSLSRAIFNAH